MMILGWTLLLFPPFLFLLAYAAYPLILALMARLRRRPAIPTSDPAEWPELTVVLPVFNEERALPGALDALLQSEYPEERLHILVVSDASSDRTDAVVKDYPPRRVQLIRLSERRGKTAAESAALPSCRGSLVVTTDATTRILPRSLKVLVRAFQDPAIGLASGRDLSVAHGVDSGSTQSESGYVGYEMWVRSLETRCGSIIGASGCFYAIRRELFDPRFPPGLSRDFGSALLTAEQGYRAVSVNDATCLVPRSSSLRGEYRRKIRTMARGLGTLWYKRRLLAFRPDPWFSVALIGHKLLRWLGFLVAPLSLIGLALLASEYRIARWLFGLASLGILLGLVALLWSSDRKLARPWALLGFTVGSFLAGFVAWLQVFRGVQSPVWEPTRRH